MEFCRSDEDLRVFVCNAFTASIMTITTEAADRLCLKNGLDVADLLQLRMLFYTRIDGPPLFCECSLVWGVCRYRPFATLRTSGRSKPVKNIRFRFMPAAEFCSPSFDVAEKVTRIRSNAFSSVVSFL